MDSTVEQLKHDMERLAKQNREAVVHGFGKAKSRQNRSNTRRQLVYDETRKQYTLRERRSNDRGEHERT